MPPTDPDAPLNDAYQVGAFFIERKIFMATSSILTNVKITDPHKVELFVNALEASSNDPKRIPASEAKLPLTDKEAIRALFSKEQTR